MDREMKNMLDNMKKNELPKKKKFFYGFGRNYDEKSPSSSPKNKRYLSPGEDDTEIKKTPAHGNPTFSILLK